MRSQRRQAKKGRGKTKSPRQTSRRKRSRRGRRYTDEQRQEALKLIAAGMTRPDVAKVIGATTETLRLWVKKAQARHGKPEAVRTDRGGAFVARREENDFDRVLEAELIDHIVGRSYHPQGGGKVESLIGTIRRELWDVEEFATRAQAEVRIDSWFTEYNHQRAHMGIDGLTPADRYFGRADQVLAAIDAVSRNRQGTIAQRLAAGTPVEEVLGLQRLAPLEVLRLVLADGHLELRFLGARVVLGPVQP